MWGRTGKDVSSVRSFLRKPQWKNTLSVTATQWRDTLSLTVPQENRLRLERAPWVKSFKWLKMNETKLWDSRVRVYLLPLALISVCALIITSRRCSQRMNILEWYINASYTSAILSDSACGFSSRMGHNATTAQAHGIDPGLGLLLNPGPTSTSHQHCLWFVQ